MPPRDRLNEAVAIAIARAKGVPTPNPSELGWVREVKERTEGQMTTQISADNVRDLEELLPHPVLFR